ncbi:choice-of-anchor D domain-containing protein [Bernardetia sp. ABR2-2B]|uniref:choice-of-anchor D domain-containing protein n=1 Tax=Bernardetia sp. ABR2-2B TaxID=3127472 RepID=UPI0030D45335
MKQSLHFKKNISFFFSLFFLLISWQVQAQWKTLITSPNNTSITYDESLVTDSQDNAYFVLEENTERISKVIKFDGNTQTELGSEGFAVETEYTSIAIDNNDIIYVAYNDLTLNRATTVKKFDGTNWVLVGNAGFSSPNSTNQSLEIDNNGTPYVLFIDENERNSFVMKFNGTNWVNVGAGVSAANAGAVTLNRLKINSNNIPYVMHNNIELASQISVKKFDGTNWVSVGNEGFTGFTEIDLQNSSFAISSSDVPYVAFQDFAQGNKVSVMKFDGNNWVLVGNAGFTANAGAFPSIVIGQNEIPYVSYKDAAFSKANVMKFDNGGWVHVGSPDFAVPVTDLQNLAISSSDKLYLLFHNALSDFYATLMTFETSSAPQLTIQADREEIYDNQTFNIGAVDYTCTANTITKTFTIRNAGFSDLVLSGNPFIQISGSSDFTVSQVRSNTIASFEAQTFAVTFKPTRAATQTAIISIRSNDPSNTPYTFNITGSGVYGIPSPINRIVYDSPNTPSVFFGTSVAIWNNYMVVGSPEEQEAIVYKYNGISWQEDAVLKGTNNLPLGNTLDFGYAVDIYEDYIVVGGWRDSFRGAAYVFHKEGSNWIQQARLTASDRQVDDYFGRSVAIDQEHIIIGAWGEDAAGGSAGAAYIYKREGTTWSEQAKLASNDLNGFDLFGFTVDIQNDWAIVGALRQKTNDSDEGAVYTFRRNENTWTQIDKLQPNDVSQGMNFGQSISISGNQLAIGTDRNNNNKGAAYIYKYNGANWIEESKITASDAVSNTLFGTSLSLYGNYLLVGVPFESSTNSTSGAAYFYKKEGANWSEIAKIKPSPAQFDEYVGGSVALHANKLVIGAQGYRSSNGVPIGAVYVSDFGGSKIEVTGNNNYILNGSSYATTSTGTDFGIADACNAGSITREFTITNKGCTTINLTGNPLISINGSSDFVVNNFTTTSIAANASATFSVTYTPNVIGVQNATISIKNSDVDNSLYTFAIQALKKDDNQTAFEAIILGESERISCQNSISLEAQSVSNATSYTWLKDGVEVGNGINYEATSSGDYQVRIKRENCLVTSESVTVLVNYAPLSEIQQQNNISFCGSGILNITSSTLQSNSNASYEWLFNNNVIGTETELRVTQSGNYTLRATKNGCSSETTITISITDSNLPSELILQSSATTLCTNVDLTLTTESISNVKYEWFRNDSLIVSNGTNKLMIDTAGKYRVKVSLNDCELISNEIEIFQAPTPYLNTSETTIFIEQEADNQNIVSVSWKLDDEVVTEFDGQITIIPKKSGSYSAVVTYQSGCIRQTEAISFVVPEGNDNQPNDWVIYPNPSTDGNFEIEFDFPLSENIEITVFDAIGRTIWIQSLQKGSNKQSFYLNRMAQGMYIIKTYSNNQTSIKKLIIK